MMVHLNCLLLVAHTNTHTHTIIKCQNAVSNSMIDGMYTNIQTIEHQFIIDLKIQISYLMNGRLMNGCIKFNTCIANSSINSIQSKITLVSLFGHFEKFKVLLKRYVIRYLLDIVKNITSKRMK